MLRLNRIGCGALRSGTGGSLGPTTTSCGVPALRWSTLTSQPPIFELKNADIYPFGVSTEPLFRQLSWTIGNSDCWAVMSSQTTSASTHNAEDLTGVVQAHARVSPSSAGIYPILKALPPIPRPASEGGPRERDIGDIIHFVSFKTSLSRTGDFDDYTARYGHIRAEDATTVRQHLMQSLPSHVADATSVEGSQLVDDTARLLQIDHLLDLPLITLSNGQTRRARILRALLHQPELLILEEPFTGLDVNSRFLLASLLSKLHAKRAPRIMLILRPQDTPLPPFISHLALVGPERGQVLLGSKEDVLETRQGRALIERGRAAVEQAEQKKVAAADRQRRRTEQDAEQSRGEPLVVLNKVNITYGTPEAPRRILHDIDWTIRAGERWLLVGHNGSGKSTLLSVLLGDHPKSFAEDVSLFGKARVNQATATIQDNIGHVSPEVSNALPRKHGPAALTAEEAILTGFDSIFSYRRSTPAQQAGLEALLEAFDLPDLLTPTFLSTPFAALAPSSQQLVLFLRALVKKPKLLVLDEPFAGMPGELVAHCKAFLDEKLDGRQAMVVVSHWDEEVPRSVDRVLRLEEGVVVEMA